MNDTTPPENIMSNARAGQRLPYMSAAGGALASGLLVFRLMKTTSQESSLQKNPDNWKTGDEPMTAAQRSYLETLATETGEPVDDDLTKAEASKRIEELRQESPRLSENQTPGRGD